MMNHFVFLKCSFSCLMKAKKKLFHNVMTQMDKKSIFTNPQKNYTAHACACVCVCACFHFWWNKSTSMLRNFWKRDTKLNSPLIESSCECRSNMNPARKTRTSSSSSFPFLKRDKWNQMRIHCWSFNLQQPKNNKNLNHQFNLFYVNAQSSSQVHSNAKSTKKNKLKNQRQKIRQFNLFDMKAWSSLPKFAVMPKTPEKNPRKLLLPSFTTMQEKKT